MLVTVITLLKKKRKKDYQTDVEIKLDVAVILSGKRLSSAGRLCNKKADLITT